MTGRRPPIFCDQCNMLALAHVDGMTLCSGCLTAAVAICQDPSDLMIAPLAMSSGETENSNAGFRESPNGTDPRCRSGRRIPPI